ncbi:MAG TPA: hypothetical protein VNF68_00860 [Candidatus Baltobacteraceae bacterium]|nr:hypothetical protein [Candidatus Baltobacteraceae bacterium]
MIPQQRGDVHEQGARAVVIGMTIIVVAAMVVALFGWHPWAGGI